MEIKHPTTEKKKREQSTKHEIKPVLGTTTIEETPKCIVTLYQFELNRSEHRTIVMVLHNLNLACRYAEHIVAIHHQTVAVQSPPEDIVTVEIIQEVFGIEVTVSEGIFLELHYVSQKEKEGI
ncbi:ATP-binding cassette domain-containing protein [Lysinibacillus xylanilyticus]|uniref:hypothetical protein n=1 Tax=Lysinibacillus xylanilyticus TaxID=582475 RepID=UPI0038034B69